MWVIHLVWHMWKYIENDAILFLTMYDWKIVILLELSGACGKVACDLGLGDGCSWVLWFPSQQLGSHDLA